MNPPLSKPATLWNAIGASSEGSGRVVCQKRANLTDVQNEKAQAENATLHPSCQFMPPCWMYIRTCFKHRSYLCPTYKSKSRLIARSREDAKKRPASASENDKVSVNVPCFHEGGKGENALCTSEHMAASSECHI